MKRDREACAGIVGERLFKYIFEDVIQRMLFEILFKVCSSPLGSKDKLLKTDFQWLVPKNMTMFGYGEDILLSADIKASIEYNNCAIDADNPAFKDDRRFIGLMFRNQQKVPLVHGKTLYDNILKYKKLNTKIDEKENQSKYYLVSVDDLKNDAFTDATIMWFSIPKSVETFGNFFNTHFTGNELKKLETIDDIQNWIRTEVDQKCYDVVVGMPQ